MVKQQEVLKLRHADIDAVVPHLIEDMDQYCTIATNFIKRYCDFSLQLDESEFEIKVHTLKGLSGLIGVYGVAQRCEALENEPTQVNLKRLLHELEGVCGEFSHHFEGKSKRKKLIKESAMEDKTILVVDDTKENIHILVELLDEYDIAVAKNGEKAIEIARNEKIDLILLDVMMPVMDGYEVCSLLQKSEKTQDIPIIFLTAKIDIADEIKGLQLGAVDYISKPFNPSLVKQRVKNQILLKEAKDLLQNQKQYLQEQVQKRTQEIEDIQTITINAMTTLAETRDTDTGNHIVRTTKYVEALSYHLSQKEDFKPRFSEQSIKKISQSAALHDIGKIGIPDNILLKPGKLSDEEFEKMKMHSQIGYEALRNAQKGIQNAQSSFLDYAKEIARSHHEKFNGKGYPDGLSGEDIPLTARIMALADVYDALVSKRVYKDAFSHEKAVEIIKEERGEHFDPQIVDAFLEIEDQFIEITHRYKG
ncbi:MAG: HD domain-containing phosphohydrolase [Campylobacterota bacterium]